MKRAILLSLAAVMWLFLFPATLPFNGADNCAQTSNQYLIRECVNTFDPALIESTSAGYQYWFVDRKLAGGKTVKLSVVRPHLMTHPEHSHAEDEFFFVLQGEARFFLGSESQIVGPNTCLYCPSNVEHGLSNVGDTELRYLVIKKYQPSRGE